MATKTKRSYNRRSEDERIADLEQKIRKLKSRLEMKQRKDSPVLREMAKVQRVLRKFAQTAHDNGRADLALSTQAFVAGLERIANAPEETGRRRGRQSEANEFAA
jgi:hypothetical protein